MESSQEQVIKSPKHIIGYLIVSHNIYIRAIRISLIILLSLVAFFKMISNIMSLYGDGVYDKDILQLYVLSRAISSGTKPYLGMPILVSQFVGITSNLFPHPTPYPPSVGIILLPLSLFNYKTAVIIWFIFEIACLILSIILLLASQSHRPTFYKIYLIFILTLIYWPITSELQLGNVNIILLLLLCGMRFAFYKQRDSLAGILLGLTFLIKPLFWPFILYFAYKKYWPIIISAVLTSFIGLLFSGFVVGFDNLWLNFFKVIPTITNFYSMTPWNFSLLSLSTRIFKGLGLSADQPVQMSFLSAPPLINYSGAVYPFWFALIMMILIITFIKLRSINDLDTLLGTSICVSILVSPLSWAYYLVLLIIPAEYLISQLWREDFPFRKTNIVILLICFNIISLKNWIDIGIRAAGNPNGFVYKPGANIVPFWSGLFGLAIIIGIIFIFITLVYFEKANHTREGVIKL